MCTCICKCSLVQMCTCLRDGRVCAWDNYTIISWCICIHISRRAYHTNSCVRQVEGGGIFLGN